MGKIALVEKFYSVQGEGFNAGRSAIFVRLAGCNLACDFAGDGSAICDTPWMETNEKLEIEELVGWIADEITGRLGQGWTRWPRRRKPMVVLTGGEPTMHPYFDDITQRLACEIGLYTAVETNGTLWSDGLEHLDWICISPKVDVPQGNEFHGEPLDDPSLNEDLLELMSWRARRGIEGWGGEFRYVIGGPESEEPPFYAADYHYLSPAVRSDGSGTMHYSGFPGFAEGAVERCEEIIARDPRWRLSLQTHKLIGAR